ncbi:MAG: glycosyltransferase [bacterium]|nr:glycosyltransferase [bacterium]
MKQSYIIVMNQFINGGVENLFITIAKENIEIKFYLIVLNNNIDNNHLLRLPGNVDFVVCNKKKYLSRFYFFLQYIRKQLNDVPVMIDFHETLQSEFFMYINKSKKRCVHYFNCNPLMRLNGSTRKDFYYHLFSFYEKIICICKGQSIILNDICPGVQDRILISYNFVVPAYIRTKSNECMAIPFNYIIMVARVDFKAKDFVTVIKAYELLDVSIQNAYKLVLVGDGPDFESLRQIVKESLVSENIILTGNQPNPYPLIKNASCFILSSYSEGFGLSVLEAMALGTPVIVSNYLCSANEIVEKDTYGLIFDIGNAVELANKITRILTDKNLYLKLSERGKQRAEFYFYSGRKTMREYFKNSFYLNEKK